MTGLTVGDVQQTRLLSSLACNNSSELTPEIGDKSDTVSGCKDVMQSYP